MKLWMKAIGFTLLFGLIYLINSGAVGAVIGVLLAIKNANMINGADSNMTEFNDAIMSGMGDYMLPLIILVNLMTLGIIMLVFLGRKDRFFTYVKFRKFKSQDGALIFSFGIFLNLIFVALLNVVANVLPLEDQMNQYSELLEPMLNGNFVLILLSVVIIAPLFEEIVIRGIIFNDFKKAAPVWVAIVIQALVFGIMHMNWIQGTYAFFLGLILGMVYLKYNTIWMPILLHLSFNLTSTLLSEIFPEDSGALFYGWLGTLGIIGTLLIGYFIYKTYDDQAYAILEAEGPFRLEGVVEGEVMSVTKEPYTEDL